MSVTPRRVLLRTWAASYFAEGEVPSDHTLRRMAREQRIVPSPSLVGKHYYVPPDATLQEDAPGQLVSRLKGR